MIEDFERFVMMPPAAPPVIDPIFIVIIALVAVISFAIGFITARRMK